jgi:competence protein ComEA
MKKLLIVLLMLSTYVFAAINVQTASKEELMSIAGIGEKKAAAIIKYRKTHKVKSADDLKGVKGIGENIIKNIKGNVKNKKRVNAKKSKTRSKAKKSSSKAKKTEHKKMNKKTKKETKNSKKKTKKDSKAKKQSKKTKKEKKLKEK